MKTAPWPVRLVLFVAACGSVFPLLAWVFGLGAFHVFALGLGGPLVAATIAVTLWMARTDRWPATRAGITAGAIGGLLGTLAYDLFRVPFVYTTGLQLLAPIDSYGVLLLDADTSSPLTAFAGWAYHFANGIGFGVAYAMIATGRRWPWGVAWALFLESVAVFSPFAGTYGLIVGGDVRWAPIVLAYAAHIPYGAAVGLFAQHAEARAAEARALIRAPVAVSIAVLVVVLAVWHRPLLPQAAHDRGVSVAAGPSAVVLDGALNPGWLRVPVDGCATVENGSAAPVRLSIGGQVEPGASVQVCGHDPGVFRIRIDDAAFSGGWLIVDPARR